MKVICNKAGTWDACRECCHSRKHDIVHVNSNEKCTKRGLCECYGKYAIVVRCIPVTEKEEK